MTISELLSKERDDYLAVLINSLLDYRVKSPPAVAEVLLEFNSNSKPPPYCFLRPDIMHGGKENPRLVEVNKDKYYDFEPFEFSSPDTVPSTLSPFHWNGIEFRHFGHVESWKGLEQWASYWLDLDDARYEADKELSNVIHNITVPKQVNDHFEFSVDMGSAEVKAFFALTSLISEMGVTRFEAGSFSMINAE